MSGELPYKPRPWLFYGHLTTGQKAMAVAIAYPDAQQGKRNDLTSFNLKEVDGINQGRLSHARKILRLTPLQVPKVMSGELPYKPRPWLFYGQWVGAV